MNSYELLRSMRFPRSLTGIPSVGLLPKSMISRVIVAVLLVVFLTLFVANLFSGLPSYTLQIEGFNTDNTECVYYPQKHAKNTELKVTFKINDFMQEAIEVPECIKTYNNLIYKSDPSSNNITNNGEYSKPIEDSELYKKYMNDIKPNETKLLDKKYGDLFNPHKMSGLELVDIQKIVADKLKDTNRQYNVVKYLAVSKPDAPYYPSEFAEYFATLINAYKTQQAQLDMIKTFLYKIIGPLFTHANLIEHYTSNSSLYSKTDDILFILNTTKEFLQNVKIEDLDHAPSPKNIVYIFKDDANNYNDKTFTVDSLTIFVMGSFLMNIYPLIDNIPDKTPTTGEPSTTDEPSTTSKPSNTTDKPPPKKAKLTTRNLFGILGAYLKKKMPNAKGASPLVFALNPDNAPAFPQ